MSALLVGAELLFAIGFLGLGVFMIWIAKPHPPALEPRYAFLRSETGQVLYSVLCLCVFAMGFATAFHGLVGG